MTAFQESREKGTTVLLSEFHKQSGVGTPPKAANPASAKINRAVTDCRTDSWRDKKLRTMKGEKCMDI